MANIRVKGATGERDVAKIINEIYMEVGAELGLGKIDSTALCQRNQLQSAVGGGDLVNTCGYTIEVKRQEKLAINSWWEQSVTSGRRTGKIPVLIYRQSGKKWRVIMMLTNVCQLAHVTDSYVRAEIELDDFKHIFKKHAMEHRATYGTF